MADGAINKTQSYKQSRDQKAYDFGYRDGYCDGWEDGFDYTCHYCGNSCDTDEPTESEVEFYCRLFELIQSGNVKQLHTELTEKIQDVTGKTITNWKIIGE